MDKLMQAILYHIEDDLLEAYCKQTAYAERRRARDLIGRKLWELLNEEQRKLLEELQEAYDSTQDAELEAMFLASFDEVNALYRRHIA